MRAKFVERQIRSVGDTERKTPRSGGPNRVHSASARPSDRTNTQGLKKTLK